MTTAIVPTSGGDIEFLIWCLSSLYLRSPGLKHIIVNINGPDSRLNSTELQDAKAAFVAEFRDAVDIEVTLVRSWSREGFGQPIQMSLPFVQTPHYVVCHDNTFVLDRNWLQVGLAGLKESDFVTTFPKYRSYMRTGGSFTARKLYFPKPNTQFVFCKLRNDDCWHEYRVDAQCQLHPEFTEWHLTNNNIKLVRMKNKFRFLDGFYPKPDVMGYSGAYFYPGWHKFQGNSSYFPKKTIAHIRNRAIISDNIYCQEIAELEAEINASPLQALYTKYSQYANRHRAAPEIIKGPQPELNEFGQKPLIVLSVYNQLDYLSWWLRIYHHSEKMGSKVMVIHHYDGDAPDPEMKGLILAGKPDWYVPKPNVGMGTAMLQHGMDFPGIDWDVLLFFQDTTMPTTPTFIRDMLAPLRDDSVGIVVPIASIEDKFDHVRTCAAAMRKETVDLLQFNAYPLTMLQDGNEFEHGPHCMWWQIRDRGLRCVYVRAAHDFHISRPTEKG